MAEGCGEQRLCSGAAIECDDDPFANFSCNPPKHAMSLRSFTRKNRYRGLAGLGQVSVSRERLGSMHGSNSSLSTLVGSSQNLLDPSRMMTMQEDAKSRRISSEVMKNRLYESVLMSPRRRRFSGYYGSGGDCTPTSFQGYARMVQSLPVTPAHSENVTPAHSPTSKKSFNYGFRSQGVTPTDATPEEEDMEVEENTQGIASIFRPRPRFIAASHSKEDTLSENTMNIDDMTASWSSGFKHPGTLGIPPKRLRRERSPAQASNDMLSPPRYH